MDGIGQLLGYRIVEQLYAGSRTLVYRGFRESDSLRDSDSVPQARLKDVDGSRTPVIIKLLRNPFPNFSELVQFRNQYTIAKNLDLPSIVKPLSLEPYENAYALVMEDFGGISLKEVLKQEGHMGRSPQTLIAFLQIAIQVTDALDGLYRCRVIHKDIKPANIVIHPDSKQVKLIDFSIASLLPRETQEIQNANMLEGTLAYLSPEQTGRMNRGIDYRSDFYALGIAFYELLTGQLPFVSNDPMELIHCHLAHLPTPVKQIQSNVPLAVSEIVCKLMAKNAEDRYQSALGLKHDLEICLYQLKETGTIQSFELGARDLCDRFLIPEKLYGRQAEVETLLNAFDRVSIGKTEMMLVAGFSGIGKTAVVNEVHKPIVRQRGYFIKGKYDQFQRNIPFSAFVQAFRDLMGQLLAESDTQLQNWKTKILEVAGENGQVLIDVIPELEHIIGKQLPTPELSGSAAQNRFNLLMQKFVQVFTTADRPLVMFLDDLQWADSASLKLLELLVQDTGHLLVIGAYRDNEVSPIHPLMLTVDEIGKTGATVHTTTLRPLSLVDLNQLVADTLKCDRAIAQPLTELVYKKTQGNPFFATQFLKSLHEDGQITFDWDLRHWQCDLAQIVALATTDDVVEFMALQLQKLPLQTQTMLKLAACIGAQFDLNTLAIVSVQSPEEAAAALWKGLQEGLIIPTTEIYKFFTQSDTAAIAHAAANPIYRFLHDRVQQAAYFLIPEAQKRTTHYHIGQLLLQQISPEAREERLFELVNQLNYGTTLITQQTERDELAQLNLTACRKARTTTAYQAAREYATVGLTLLGETAWQQQYETTLAFHELAAEVAYLCGDLQQMEEFIQTVIAETHTLVEQVNVCSLKIQVNTTRNKLVEAIDVGLQFLQQLGVTFNEAPTPQDIRQEIEEIKKLIGDRKIEELADIPVMIDKEKLAILQIITKIYNPIYTIASPSYPLLVSFGVKLSIQYGNTSDSPVSYISYAILACVISQDIDTATEFGLLARQVNSRLENKAIKAEVLYVLGMFILHRKLPLKDTLSVLQESYITSIEVGSLMFVGFAAQIFCSQSFWCGQPLIKLEQDTRAYGNQLVKLNQVTTNNYCRIYWQSILNLLGFGEHPVILSGEAMQETELVPRLLSTNDFLGLFSLYLFKLTLGFWFGEIESANNCAIESRNYLVHYAGSVGEPVFYFYDSLVALAQVIPDSEEAAELLERVAQNQNQLQQYWAHFAPMNHQHKVDLVSAEKCRVLGQKADAIELYDKAISGAKTNGYIQEEALAHELAAKFYLDWGKDAIAQTYLIDAYYAYSRWGAKAKVADLEQRYPQLLAPILQRQQSSLTATETIFTLTCPSKTSTSSSASEGLDIATILKASQALSGEIELEKLLSALLRVVLENAGADKCALLLPKDEHWAIEAFSQLGQPEVILQSISLEGSHAVPISLINRVKHTLQPSVIGNAIADPTLAADPYIQRQCPKSVLCTPILHQGKLIGILYLENNLTIEAFTSDRIKLLNLICAQAAISLENARLYQRSQQALTDLEEAQLQIVQSEKMSALGNLVAGIAHEINNPVAFLNGNINPALDYIKDIFGLLDLYQQKYPQSSPAIQDEIEAIDLEFIRDDLPKLVGSMREGVKRIRDISTSLRTFSRTDSDYPVACNIHDGINSTLMILKHRLKANESRPEINVITDYGDLPKVECFAGQLNQVFMNLLANAIDALEESNRGRSFKEIKANPNCITIKTQRSHDLQSAVIAIADNGVGMTDEVKQKIFDRLFTTKDVGKGTGLGLAISHSIIVDKHLGTLKVHSTLGQGTEFAIAIPIQAKA